jgi:transglutaminase-like putative cysteine protease
MGIQVELHHGSRYLYDKPVSLGPQIIQLRPAPHGRTAIASYSLEVTPADRLLNWQFDPLANHVARVIFPSKTTEFTVDVTFVADLTPFNPFGFLLEPGVETYPFAYTTDQSINLGPYLYGQPTGAELRRFLQKISVEKQGTMNFLVGLNRKVRDQVAYTTRMEHGVQTCEQTLGGGTGSCRDSAWLLVQILRNLGLAARFVSGYLIQLAADEPSTDDAAGPAEDTADLHAWAEVFLPGAGWIGLDPTSGLLAAEGHIPLACTPTALEAAPIGGTVEHAQVKFSHTMTVRRLNDSPRLSKPYSETEWARMREVAHSIDRDMAAQDIRMTMGGEPTYVAMDDPELPEWNLEALGSAKRSRGLALIRGLRQRTAPGGLLHFGQGKWYPGEPLPRWAFQCISRLDGAPDRARGTSFRPRRRGQPRICQGTGQPAASRLD